MKFVSEKILKVTQHGPYFENVDVGDDEEYLEAPNCHILSVHVAKNNARICQIENVLKGSTRSWPRSSFAPFDRNCSKQRRIFNCCDQVYLQSIKHIQEFYTYPCGNNINKMLLIGQLMCFVTSGREEKLNTYTYYKCVKKQSTSGGH